MIGANTCSDGDLEVLCLGQTFCSEVTRVEAANLSTLALPEFLVLNEALRGGDDDFGIDELLIELAVLAFLIGSGHEGVSLVLEPFPDAKLVLGSA